MDWTKVLSKEACGLGYSLYDRAVKENHDGKIIYPPSDQIFRAFHLTPPDKVKVCIVGQDPYHTPGAANGLAFSISDGCPIQPSLTNIFKELVKDIGCEFPKSGDLTPWANQGVLLINNSLTVYEHQPNSHANWGWKNFTKSVLNTIACFPQPIVFIFWGANAQDLLKNVILKAAVYSEDGKIIRQRLIDKACILSSHPSPFSVNKPCRNSPPFKGSKPFSTTNDLLIEMGAEPIDWKL